MPRLIRSSRLRISAVLIGLGLLLTSCGDSGSVQEPGQAPAPGPAAPAAPSLGAAPNDKSITVSGELTVAGQGDPLRLAPSGTGKAFDLEITGVGTVYKIALATPSEAGAGSWALEMRRSPVSGNRNWSVSLAPRGTDPFTCGGLTMTSQPLLLRCDAAQAALSTDRTTLTLTFSGTQLIANFGQRSSSVTGKLEVVFPAPLAIASLDDYPSGSSGSVLLNDESAPISAIIKHSASDGSGGRLEALLEAPAVANSLTLDSTDIYVTLPDQEIPGEGVVYSCGRPLSDAEYACLESPITLGVPCDRSFLVEARRCRSLVHEEVGSTLRGEFNETLYDDITSRQVKSVRARATLTSGPPMRGRITSADGRFAFSCDGKCNVSRSVSATQDDIAELSILSYTAASGTDHALSIRRSLLYQGRITVILDLLYSGSSESASGYPAIDANAVQFNDETSEIELESLRLTGVGGQDAVILSGTVAAFAR